jgi:methionyl-tRNA formyltransferase
MKDNILFLGAGPYVIPVLDSLRTNFDIGLVVTTEHHAEQPVPNFCDSRGISFISVSSSSELENLKPDFRSYRIAVLASFGIIVPDAFLNIFELGILNIHPSLLPKYRGPTPVQTAILSGDEKTGVSIIKLDPKLDHGPILVQSEQIIEPADTSESLYKKLFKLGAELLVEALPNYLSGELEPSEQEHSKATYTEPLTRES